MSLRQALRSEAKDLRGELHPLDARVHFTASGPLGLSVRGRGRELMCFEDNGALVFSVPLNGIKTGISLRDSAMHDLLGTRRYPSIELRVPWAGISVPKDKASVEGTSKGVLTLRGRSGTVDVSYQIKRDGGFLEVTGSTRIAVDQWGVTLPRHMGFGLKTQVPVKVVFRVDAASIAF